MKKNAIFNIINILNKDFYFTLIEATKIYNITFYII